VGDVYLVFFCPLLSIVPPGELLALPFYRLKGRIRLTTNPRGCLGGEGKAGTIGVAVATCPVRADHPWGVVAMLSTGQLDVRSDVVDVRFPVVDVRVTVPLFD
jgi:hypothetical protein